MSYITHKSKAVSTEWCLTGAGSFSTKQFFSLSASMPTPSFYVLAPSPSSCHWYLHHSCHHSGCHHIKLGATSIGDLAPTMLSPLTIQTGHGWWGLLMGQWVSGLHWRWTSHSYFFKDWYCQYWQTSWKTNTDTNTERQYIREGALDQSTSQRTWIFPSPMQ